MNYPILLTAGQDLFNEAWTQGDLYSIQPIVNALGTFACWVISVVGFGIVIFSILKNALSGLYVINPKMWDKVDEVKKAAIQGTQSMTSGGNQVTAKLGGILTFVLSYVPNVKELTDFEDDAAETIDKKQYFAKSIPLLVAQIFIGMLIFQGYPAQIANWIGSGATYALGAVMSNVDPVEFVTGLSDSLIQYNLSTDGSQDPLEKNINKMTSDMMTVVKTKYSDIEADPAQETAYKIEDMLLSAFQGDVVFSNVLGAAEGYRINIGVSSQTSMPTISQSYAPIGSTGVYVAQATNGTYSFKYWVSGASLPTGSTKVSANDYFVWTVTATPEAISNTSAAELIVFAGVSAPTTTSSSTQMTVQGITVGNGQNDLKGTLGKSITVDLIDSQGNVVTTLNAVLTGHNVQQVSNVSPRLEFSSGDKTILQAFKNGSAVNGTTIAYMRLNLVGSWSKSFETGSTTTTLKMTEIRILPRASSASYGISTWEDMGSEQTQGVSITSANIQEMLNRKNSQGN